MREITGLTIVDYRWYVLQGHWKYMCPERMIDILKAFKTQPYMDEERKKKVNEILGELYAKTHKDLLPRNGVRLL